MRALGSTEERIKVFANAVIGPLPCILIDLGPAYIKSLVTILSDYIHDLSWYFNTFPCILQCIVWHLSLLATKIAIATIIAPSDASNNGFFPQIKHSIYFDWFCKSLKCNHNFVKSLEATGFSLKKIINQSPTKKAVKVARGDENRSLYVSRTLICYLFFWLWGKIIE